MNDDLRFQHFLNRNAAYDGKFLTGVLSTGIYCLASCPARRPKRENVRFFRSPDEARKSGLRPCHRCHPDWFYRGEEWYENLYERTAARVRQAPAAFPDIAAIGAAAGISRTALNELFREHGQESPAAFLRRVRVEHVCRLLESGMKPADAAARAGFESTSAFHQQFLARTGMTPGAYAGLRTAHCFELRLPSGYRFREVLDFYGRDPHSASEQVVANGLKKALLVDGETVLIEVMFSGDVAAVCVDGGNRFQAHRAVVRMLGFEADAAGFERQFADDPLLGGLLQRQRGLRIPMTPEPWEALAWAIIGQQISVKAAVALRRELIVSKGVRHRSGLCAHPGAEAVADMKIGFLRKLKFSGSKAEYLIGAAKAVAGGELPLVSLREMSVKNAARRLGTVRGIGPWTTQYVFLRGFGFADCLPSGDAGLAQGLARLTGARPAEPQLRETMGRFAPYRSLATYHIWASLKGVSSDAF
jgi:AraC family transcriptional regulator, regulatory protein of adaptative response / DNA-3-methyladenine glycosylase II